MKHAPFALAALTAGALVLTGCAAGSDPDAEVAAAANIADCDPAESSLTATFGPQATPAMELAVAQLEADYPGLTVNATPTAMTSYDDLTKAIVADIAVGNRPDVIMSGLGQLRFWVDTYEPAPLDTDALPETYQTQFLPAGAIDGTVYLAPAQISAPVLLVNVDLLEAADAGDAEDIVDYETWIEAAQAVTDHTGTPSVGIATLGLADWYAQAFVQGGGGEFVAADGTAGFGDATGVEALSIWSDLHDAGLELGIVNDQDVMAQFVNGNTAFMVYTTSAIASLQGAIGDSFEWIPIDLPTLDGRSGPLPAGGNGWIVLSDEPCDAAFANALVANLLAPEVVLAASGEQFSYIPVDAAAAEELLDGDAATPQLTYAWSYDKELSPWGGFAGDVTTRVNDTFRSMAQQLQAGADPETAIQSAVEAVDAIVAE